MDGAIDLMKQINRNNIDTYERAVALANACITYGLKLKYDELKVFMDIAEYAWLKSEPNYNRLAVYEAIGHYILIHNINYINSLRNIDKYELLRIVSDYLEME